MLAWPDYLVLALYLTVVAGIGLYAARGQRSTTDYFLGSRAIPWWAAGLSILATETSALTFLGVPVQSLFGNWTYVQLVFGSVAARFFVAGVLIPAYYRAGVFTVYGWLAQRFGPWTKNAAVVLFFVGRTLGSGVRLYGAAIALVILAPGRPSFPLVIAVLASVAVVYTILGGIKSVIWTDVMQGVVLVGAGVVAVVFLVAEAGGPGAAFEQLAAGRITVIDRVPPMDLPVVRELGPKLQWLDLSLDPGIAYTLIGGLIGSAFLTMATHGTDQDMIQRALTCADERGGRRSLWLSAAVTPVVVVVFLAIGSLLWVRYQSSGVDARVLELAGRYEISGAQAREFVFPVWVLETLPAGVRGLIFAGVFAAAMSSLDSAIAALASTAVKDIWQPYIDKDRDEAHYLRVSRAFAVAFGVLLVAVAILVWLSESGGSARQGFGILMLGLKVLTWVFPPLLGVLLAGVLTRRGSDRGNLLALVVGCNLLLAIEFLPAIWGTLSPGPELVMPISWIWNSMIGCVVTFAIAVLFPAPERDA